MMLTLLQVIAMVAVAFYLYQWKIGVRRRNAQSWDALLARLRSDWGASAICNQCCAEKNAHRSPRARWRQIRGAHGLWAMHQNAGVMLEMANYALRHCAAVNPEILSSLRKDAIRIQTCVLKSIARIALGAVSESICISALRAESAYAEMVLHMTALLKDSAEEIVPAFAAAM